MTERVHGGEAFMVAGWPSGFQAEVKHLTARVTDGALNRESAWVTDGALNWESARATRRGVKPGVRAGKYCFCRPARMRQEPNVAASMIRSS